MKGRAKEAQVWRCGNKSNRRWEKYHESHERDSEPMDESVRDDFRSTILRIFLAEGPPDKRS